MNAVRLAELYLLVAMYAAVPLAVRFGCDWKRSSILAGVVCAGFGHAALHWRVEWLVMPWLGFTTVIAAWGLRRLVGRGLRDWAECSIDAGCMLLPIGAAWSFAWIAGLEPLETKGVWVLLTAVHFHWAAFVLPVVVGGFGRLTGAPGPFVAAAIVIAIPMTAIGIAMSEPMEVVAALTLAGAASIFALSMFRRVAFVLPALALLVAMSLAAMFALRAGPAVLQIDGMVTWHGSSNALGFGLLSLVALNFYASPVPRLLVPFSRLRGDFQLGSDYFERHGLAVEGAARGLVDDLSELDGPGFAAADVHPGIRDFYENTTDYDLDVSPQWKWWSSWAGAVWYRIANRMQQTVFPPTTGQKQYVASRIFALDARRDGRTAPRAWVRTFEDGRAMYVAAYSTHTRAGRAYMNIAFPFWRSNMASILFPLNTRGTGLRLDTVTAPTTPDAGIWQVTNLGPIRLPLREFIEVWMDGDTMRAVHELRAWGVCYLRLDYVMRRRAT